VPRPEWVERGCTLVLAALAVLEIVVEEKGPILVPEVTPNSFLS